MIVGFFFMAVIVTQNLIYLKFEIINEEMLYNFLESNSIVGNRTLKTLKPSRIAKIGSCV